MYYSYTYSKLQASITPSILRIGLKYYTYYPTRRYYPSVLPWNIVKYTTRIPSYTERNTFTLDIPCFYEKSGEVKPTDFFLPKYTARISRNQRIIKRTADRANFALNVKNDYVYPVIILARLRLTAKC